VSRRVTHDPNPMTRRKLSDIVSGQYRCCSETGGREGKRRGAGVWFAGVGESGAAGQGLPVSIRVLRSMLALPVTRFSANCSRACRWAEPDGDFRLAYSAHIKIR
jgi:hypothetical protein